MNANYHLIEKYCVMYHFIYTCFRTIGRDKTYLRGVKKSQKNNILKTTNHVFAWSINFNVYSL